MNIGPRQRHPTDNTVYLRLAVVAPKSPKFSENSNLQPFRFIQDHRTWCLSKAYILTNTDFGIGLSHTVFEILTHFDRK